jgi:two-component system cell cycle response regulator DivK
MTVRSITGRHRVPSDRPLVLLVDDLSDSRAMYVEHLRDAGFGVAEAATGHEALERAFALRPDLVVMDLALPSLDGWEATRRLKGDLRTAHVPVIALTGHALQRHSQRAAEAGCAALLIKPCLPEVLVAEIRRVLQEENRRRR